MGEFRFGQDLVRALLREQHPDLAGLELQDVAGGWDNQQWRLGAELAVRLPRTERAPALVRTEQKWLPVLADRLTLPTPTPVRTGEPSDLFGHTWTIVRWVDGEPADHAPITRADAAGTLGGFLKALHQQAPADAPASPTRGIPLAGCGTSSRAAPGSSPATQALMPREKPGSRPSRRRPGTARRLGCTAICIPPT